MNQSIEACRICPVREACPPQKLANRLTIGVIEGTEETLIPEQQRNGFSNLQKVINIYSCPSKERSRLTNSLRKKIHPHRSPDFNSHISPHNPEDVGITVERLRTHSEPFLRAKGVLTKRHRPLRGGY